MLVTLTYYINVLKALFSNVYQGFAKHFIPTQAHFALFSFAFTGKYNNAPAGNTVAGEMFFLKGFA